MIYYNDMHAGGHIIQPWLPRNGKIKNPEIAQYQRWMIQVVSITCSNPEEIGSNDREEIDVLAMPEQ